jgi:hypothetical protein
VSARWVSQRLASRTTARQVEAALLADRVAAVVDAAIVRHWRAASFQTPLLSVGQHQGRLAAAGLVPAARAALGTALLRLASWGHRSARQAIAATLPRAYLREAASRRLGLTESFRSTAQPCAVDVLEARYAPSVSRFAGPPRRPGEVELALRALGIPASPFDPLASVFGEAPIREPAVRPLSAEAERGAFLDLLFPAPPLEVVQRILYAPVGGLTWEQRLEKAADPGKLARIPATVAQGIAAGKTHTEIAAELVPVVDGVRSAARRIARFECMRVTHSIQEQAWSSGLSDLLIGYQIHAVLDHATRPTHWARNGTIYYLRPEPGQKGLDEMPHPPLEADGSPAWGCRCHNAPVLRRPSTVPDAGFTTAEDKLIGDPVAYSDWWDATDDRRRKVSVGARRFALGQQVTGERVPSWATFVEPDTGELLPLSTLRGESPAERATRVSAVRQLMAERRAALRRAYLGAGL